MYSPETLFLLKEGLCLSCKGTGIVSGFNLDDGHFSYKCDLCNETGKIKRDKRIITMAEYEFNKLMNKLM